MKNKSYLIGLVTFSWCSLGNTDPIQFRRSTNQRVKVKTVLTAQKIKEQHFRAEMVLS